MYLSHYNLSVKPFQISPDPEFIWFGEKYAEALATLEYGIQEDKGFVLLTGDEGTGKTAMIDAFSNKIDQNVIKITISDPVSDYLDFANILSREFRMNKTFTGKGEFLVHFKTFLRQAYLQNKKVVLIIDDAQKFSGFLLEEIRLLSDIDFEYTKLINIFLVGRNGFNNILSQDGNRALRQRIGLRYKLDPLNELETREYIDHRLRVAGSDKEIFSPGAVKQIHLLSSGYPERINLVCDQALQTGYSLGLSKIEKKTIKERTRELRPPDPPEMFERQGISYTDEDAPPPFFSMDRGIRWGRMYSAAAIFVLVFIGTYFFNNAPPDQSQSSITAENAFQYYQRYEEIINRVRSEQSYAVEDSEPRLSNETNTQKKSPVNAGKANVLPQSFIIYFQENSNSLSKNSLEALVRLTTSIKSLPNSAIIIKGYTDSTGNYWYNKKLSKIRADIVKDQFIKNGINAARIKTLGLGPESPLESNETENGRKLNRRVEIEIVSADQMLVLSQKQADLKEF
jgi:general secretion pathway protein A